MLLLQFSLKIRLDLKSLQLAFRNKGIKIKAAFEKYWSLLN